MSEHAHIDSRWRDKIYQVRRLGPHADMRIEFSEVGPIPDIFKRHVGAPKGQIEDYRYPLKDGAGIHLKKYSDHYRMHWDKKDPSIDPIGHLVEDAPQWLVATGVASIGALLLYKHQKNQ